MVQERPLDLGRTLNASHLRINFHIVTSKSRGLFPNNYLGRRVRFIDND